MKTGDNSTAAVVRGQGRRAEAGNKRLGVRLLALGLALTSLVLAGCSAPSAGGGANDWEYNMNTGYPAVGSTRF